MAEIIQFPGSGDLVQPGTATLNTVQPSAIGVLQLARSRRFISDLPPRASLLDKIIVANYFCALGQLTGYEYSQQPVPVLKSNSIINTLHHAAATAVSAAYPDAFSQLQGSLARNPRFWLGVYTADTYPEYSKTTAVVNLAESYAAEELLTAGFPELLAVPVEQSHDGDQLISFTRWAAAIVLRSGVGGEK